MKKYQFLQILSFIVGLIRQVKSQSVQEFTIFPLALSKDDKNYFAEFAKKYTNNMQVFNCDSQTALYLRAARNQYANISLDNQKPYFEVEVSLTFFRIDSWDKNHDFFSVQVNNLQCIKQFFDHSSLFYSSKCGTSRYDEELLNIKCNVQTNQNPIQIKLISNLDDDIDDESWAFRDFQAKIKLCPEVCLSCTSPSKCNSCISGYFLQNDNCGQCSSKCQECDNGAENCTKCDKSTYLINNKCESSCPTGYFQNQNSQTCDKCNASCNTCSTSFTCDTCQEGYFKSIDQQCVKQCTQMFYGDPITKKCSLQCSDKYFANKNTNLCEICDQNCLTCSESSKNCTSCPSNSYLITQSAINDPKTYQCVQQCPSQFYLDDVKKQCFPCYKGCKICSGPLFNQCRECNQNFDQQNDKCLRQDCGDFYYVNPENNECSKCKQNCKKCKDLLSCDLCVKDQDSLGNCNNPCLQNQFYENNQCSQCHQSCEECYGQNDNQCLSCSNEKIVLDGKCVCKERYYLDKDNVCKQCDQTCQSCSKDNQGSIQCDLCISNLMIPKNGQCQCKEGLILENNKCKCKENYFFYIDSCLNCHQSCKDCKGPGIDECTGCKDENMEINQDTKICICKQGYFFNEKDGQCQKCHQTCQTCSSNGESDCYSCINDSNLVLEDVRAEKSACKCKEGFYFDISLKKCQQCSAKCKNCRGNSENDCLSCIDDLMSLQKSDGQNYGICICQDSVFFDESQKKCSSCHNSCSKCSGKSEQECISCLDPNSIMENKKCICKQGYYLEEFKCIKCHSDCQTCTGSQSTDCLSCNSENKQIQNINNQKGKCVCKADFYQNNQFQCIKCYQGCKKCNGPEKQNCLDCSEGNDFIKDKNGNCVCDDGLYEPKGQNNQRVCLKCNQLCSKCDNQGKCISCKSQLMKLSNDLSTCECIEGYLLQENQCIKCPYFCQKCQAKQDGQQICLSCNDPRTMEINPENQSCQCKQNFFKYQDQCKSCSLNCKSCIDGTDKDCILCSDEENMIKDSEIGQCKCKDDLVFDSQTRKCLLGPQQQCQDEKCLKCNKNQCIQCISNYFPKGNSCNCKDGFFDSGENQGCFFCQQQNCLSCKTRDSCDVCEQGLIAYKGQCFCPNSKYKDDQNQCSLSCPSKCKLCLGVLECSLTKEESDKYNYRNCDISCGKCSGPTYYDCWSCESNTRVYDENLRTCQCKSGYLEVFERDCQEINQIYTQLSSIFSTSSGSFTFFFMILSLMADSVFSKTSTFGFSCLFAYSYIQFQQLGNFILVNEVYPLGIEQNFLSKFLQVNYFNQIPSSQIPLNESKLNRILEQSQTDGMITEYQNETKINNLFNNPKYILHLLCYAFTL